MKSRIILQLALTLLQLFSICHSWPGQTQKITNDISNEGEVDKDADIVPPKFQLSPQQLADYKRDGYIIIRGLLSGKELKSAIQTAKKLNRISLLQRLYNIVGSGYRKLSFQTWRTHKSMEYVAFDSSVPSIVAQAMGYDSESTSSSSPSSPSPPPCIRLLKDAFLVYQDGGVGCGWHVDDKYFWPCEDSPVHTPDAGVNVWITLSPLRSSEGGGLAIAPTSHSISWREDARAVISGATSGIPQTCAMEKLSPDFHNKFEELKKTFDMEPGDAIIHDRYIFHRSDKFTKERTLGFRKRSKFRISLRYMPSKAGVVVNEARVQDQGFVEKGMKTGDALEKGGEYFPQVWPISLSKERKIKAKEEKSFVTWKTLLMIMKNKRAIKKK